MNIALVDTDPARIALCRDIVNSVKGCYVCWVAGDAAEATAKTAINPPNLILVDLKIALHSVEKIMHDNPCTILVMADRSKTSSAQVFRVMGQGALDVVTIEAAAPSASMEALRNKIMMVQLLHGTERRATHKKRTQNFKAIDKQYPPLVLIGASTGGPAALATLLSGLSMGCPYAFVVVQHVDSTFAPGLAAWLQKETGVPVEIAKGGSRPVQGKVLIASSEDHLIMNSSHQLYYTPYPVEKPYKPSIDVFFDSVATHWPNSSIAILLTGMGSDGAWGLKQLRTIGWHTIVQHEASCIVYGMPKVAVELDAAAEILSIDEIALAIEREVEKNVDKACESES